MRGFYLGGMIICILLLLVACGNKETESAAKRVKGDNQTDVTESIQNEKTEEIESAESGKMEEGNDNSQVAIEKVPVYQEFDFGPNIDLATIPDENKNDLQKILNEYGDPSEGDVEVEGFYAGYDEKGGIELRGFIRNGTMHNIFDIQGPINLEKSDGEIIASADFVFTKEEFGVLSPGKSRVWGMYFLPEYVNTLDADLTQYRITFTLKYKY